MGILENIFKYKKRALELLKKGKIGEIIFSNRTYEVEVIDKKTFWPYIKIDDEKNVLDAFCNCESEKEICLHIAAAYFSVIDEKPLHVQFEKSFWKNLFFVLGKRYGFDVDFKEKYLLDGFLIETKNEKFLSFLKKQKNLSFKSSSFSFEEIENFKKKRASNEMLFEMSIFSDLAKEFFFLQKKEEYRVKYFYDKDSFPNKIKVFFKSIFLEVEVNKDEFEELVFSLKTIKSPLSFFDYEDGIEKILYDKKKTNFYVKFHKGFFQKIKNLKKEKFLELNNFIYFCRRGFVVKKEPFFLRKKIILEKDFADFFKKKDLLKKVEENIDFSSKEAKYHLFFKDNNLHILLYLFEKDDFLKKYSKFFDPCAYIDGRGFFCIKDFIFKEKEKIILEEDLSDFIDQNKSFFQGILGFEIHFGNFSEEIVYEVTKKGDLKFNSKLIIPESFKNIINFGRWVYVENIGFFSKRETLSPIKPNILVHEKDVSRFISQNKKDLEQIKNFFITKNPLERVGVKIFLKDNIEIVPKIILKPCFEKKEIRFFKKFLYIQNTGFFEIFYKFRLPKGYEKKRIVLASQEDYFINFEMDKLKPFIIYIDKRLRKPDFLSLEVKKIERKEKRYFLTLQYKTNVGILDVLDIFKNKEKKYLFSLAGLIDLKMKRLDWIKDLDEERVCFNKIEFRVLEILQLFSYEDVKILSLEDKKIIDEIFLFRAEKPILINFKATLWRYQEEGVKWLWFLYLNNLSGFLCDEMGLGKTHQALAMISLALKKGRKFLIVAPTSVLYHWEDLLKDTLNNIKILFFHGILREMTLDFDVLITSYGILRLENDFISSICFEVAIFDEIQIAKNASSKTNKALKNVRANMFLGLTGTLIENNLYELKALFDIFFPNYFPSKKGFYKFFVEPILKNRNQKRQDILLKLISPFILRREKKQVLLDLPQKIETISHIELLEGQKQMYIEISKLSKKRLLQNIENISSLHIFSLLSKLKQVCDHPVLINKDFKNWEKYQSGKFELFKELLNEARESKQKIVVFSQYLVMIDIFKSFLHKQNISYASIIGSTKNRKKEVKRFQEDENCTVFLASLLAAGMGINLSSASIVIHYDRWWNPAKENQATDRVHRIGQNRGVQVFKLVTKNTIEERIHEIIESKRFLIEELLHKEDKDLFTKEDLIEILKQLPD